MIWVVDASALVKRYVNEAGSSWIRQNLSDNRLIIAQITQVEMIAALGRRHRLGNISRFALYQARRRFVAHRDAAQYQIIETDERLIEEAMQLAFTHGLRAYDAVQLATALRAATPVGKSKIIFVTADKELINTCASLGLPAENPLDY